MGISGRANGKAPLCMVQSVTPKGREGLTEACADGNPVLLFGSNETHRETTALVKIRTNQ